LRFLNLHVPGATVCTGGLERCHCLPLHPFRQQCSRGYVPRGPAANSPARNMLRRDACAVGRGFLFCLLRLLLPRSWWSAGAGLLRRLGKVRCL
jgi:hypothetical protein